jgi:uncharacterized Zn-finger protein
MGSAMFGMVLMVLGFTAAVGPILYAIHLTVARERARHASVIIPLIVEDGEKSCPYCGEVVCSTDLVDISRETQYAVG